MSGLIVNNSVKLPFGTKLSITINGRTLRMIKGTKLMEFFAYFEDNDVDFEVCCDNRECYRGILMTLTINDQTQPSIYFGPLKMHTIGALETNGRKLHFLSQNCDAGIDMVAQTAHEYGIGYDEASIICSRIAFRIEVERCKMEPKRSLYRNSSSRYGMTGNDSCGSDMFSGERGVVCFGDTSDEQFTNYEFIADPTFIVNQFVIEMRMQRKYGLTK